MSTVVSALKKSNEQYVSSFDKGHLALPPAKKYLVLTCMDARIDPAAALGIGLGDAHVIRNAGANANDALRSIIISQQLLGTNEIILVKHTGCGMLTFRNEDAYQIVAKNLGSDAHAELNSRNLDFGPFPDLEKAVRDDIKLLRETKLVSPDVKISGWVYEVETGRARPVVQ